MSLIGRVAKSFRNVAVTDPKAFAPSLWNLLTSQVSSGVDVNEHNALTNSAVWCAINLLSGSISTLPLRLIKEKNGKKDPANRNPVYRVMHTRWNDYMTAQVGREVLAAHVLTWGNGYAEIVRNPQGQVVELWPVAPDRVKPEMEAGKLVYKVQTSGGVVTLPRERMLHVPGLGFDGFMGYSVVGLAAESIGMGKAMEQFGAKFYSNGTHPGLIVSHPHTLSPQGSENLRNSLAASYSGLGNAGRLMLLEEAMEVKSLTLPLGDSQFLESRQFQIPEIARWFNLPPHKLKDLTKSSFSNIESEQISFVTESVMPWLIRFETNFNMQLLTPLEQQDHYFKHAVEGLLRGDAKSRAEFYSKLFGIGGMTINEIRRLEDLDPVKDGDRHFVPLNMTTLDKIDEEPKNDNQPPQSPEQEIKDREQGRRGNLIPL